jgi:hypothetical protein
LLPDLNTIIGNLAPTGTHGTLSLSLCAIISESTAPNDNMDSATIITPPATFAILPTGGGFDFETEAEFFLSNDEAFDYALDWSVEIAVPVRVYAKRNGEWVPIREVEA